MPELPVEPISNSVVSVPGVAAPPSVAAQGGTDAPSAGQAAHDAAHPNPMGWGARRRAGVAKTISAADKAHWGPSADLLPKVVAPPATKTNPAAPAATDPVRKPGQGKFYVD